MKKDLIVGCYTNYSWDKIKFWVNSIDQCGFTGDKMMVIYNSDIEPIHELIKRNFKLFAFNQHPETLQLYYPNKFVIAVQRFADLWRFFSSIDLNEYRYIIHTDVKDVIFQKNPSDWLTDNMGDAKLLASCESLNYEDEPWGNENLADSFPMAYDGMKSKPIWNCGVQAGDPIVLRDLWLVIYNMCTGNQVHNPDQAAYNVLLNLEPYKQITKFVMSEDAWAAQLGTTMDPKKIEDFKPKLLEPQPIWSNNSVCTSIGIEHTIVHQYDRVPSISGQIEAKYK